MTAMTITPANTNEIDPYYLGRADAYDDSNTLTILEMTTRAWVYADMHPDVMYVLGYMDRLIETRRENVAVTAAETELAHADLKAGAR